MGAVRGGAKYSPDDDEKRRSNQSYFATETIANETNDDLSNDGTYVRLIWCSFE